MLWNIGNGGGYSSGGWGGNSYGGGYSSGYSAPGKVTETLPNEHFFFNVSQLNQKSMHSMCVYRDFKQFKTKCR